MKALFYIYAILLFGFSSDQPPPNGAPESISTTKMPSALEPPPKASPSATPRLGVSKSAARGVFQVLKVDDPRLASEPAWTDPNVVGVLLRTCWSSVEPTQSS